MPPPLYHLRILKKGLDYEHISVYRRNVDEVYSVVWQLTILWHNLILPLRVSFRLIRQWRSKNVHFEWGRGGGGEKKSIPNTNHMEEVGRHICASSQKKPVYRSSTHYYNFNFPQEQVGWGLRSTQLSAENLKISTMQTNSGIPLRLSYIHHMFIVYFGSTHWLHVVDDHLKLSNHINFNFIFFESDIWLFGDDFASFIFEDSERKELYLYFLLNPTSAILVYIIHRSIQFELSPVKVLTVINTLRNTICKVWNKCWQLRR